MENTLSVHDIKELLKPFTPDSSVTIMDKQGNLFEIVDIDIVHFSGENFSRIVVKMGKQIE